MCSYASVHEDIAKSVVSLHIATFLGYDLSDLFSLSSHTHLYMPFTHEVTVVLPCLVFGPHI
jgi:hypothetical protein